MDSEVGLGPRPEGVGEAEGPAPGGEPTGALELSTPEADTGLPKAGSDDTGRRMLGVVGADTAGAVPAVTGAAT